MPFSDEYTTIITERVSTVLSMLLDMVDKMTERKLPVLYMRCGYMDNGPPGERQITRARYDYSE